MNNTRITLLTALLAAVSTAYGAETVLLNEDFNGDFRTSFQSWYDGDGLTPHPDIAPYFYSSALEGYAPWWTVRDRAESPDKFMASHSYYTTAGTSNDWLISVPIEISSTGFVLEFDAQSVNVRGADYLSDLSVYVVEGDLYENNMPTTPDMLIMSVPWGNDPDNCEGDWTHYTFELDAYAGQTVRICFVNQNTDKDIVCIDNVRVYRHDPAELRLGAYPSYTTEAKAQISAVVEVGDSDIHHGKVRLTCDGTEVAIWTEELMVAGKTYTFETAIDIEAGEAGQFTFTFDADESATLYATDQVTRMAFMAPHRIFMEETTSLYCGNCPVGIYTLESLVEDPELGEYVAPVSVHIASLGYDPMATADYYSKLPINTQAPLVFIERNNNYDGFMSIDGNYDPTNPLTFAYRIAQRISTPAMAGLTVDAEWVIQGTDTIGIKCEARVQPAINIKGKEYRVAFVLTENNVGLDRNRYWVQTNYMSGVDYESRCGGWCDLGEYVPNARYHDVARAISSYHGHINSLPSDMSINEEYTFSHTMTIPDTNYDLNGVHIADPITRSNCEITAIVIDHETGLVLNAARIPMSENATNRFKVSDLLGINDVTVDSADGADTQYYDLMGRPVAPTSPGIYITSGKKIKVIR